MRFLGIGDYCDLGALYLRLSKEGHEIKVFISHPLCRGTMAGLVEHTADWRGELPWVRAAGREGIILFENVAEERGAKGIKLPGASVVLDRKGERFAEVFEENQRRVWVALSDIPEHVQKAFVAAEDKRFLRAQRH